MKTSFQRFRKMKAPVSKLLLKKRSPKILNRCCLSKINLICVKTKATHWFKKHAKLHFFTNLPTKNKVLIHFLSRHYQKLCHKIGFVFVSEFLMEWMGKVDSMRRIKIKKVQLYSRNHFINQNHFNFVWDSFNCAKTFCKDKRNLFAKHPRRVL